jgi:hypothetical protein
VPVEQSSVPVGSTGNIVYTEVAAYQVAAYQESVSNVGNLGVLPTENAPCQGEKVGEANPIADLLETFPYCDTLETFAAVIEWYDTELVEDAIALQSSQPERLKLQKWFDQLSQPESTAGEELAQTEPIESESLRDRLSQCINIPSFKSIVEGFPVEEIKAAIGQLPERDRDRVAHYWHCLRHRGNLYMSSLQNQEGLTGKPSDSCDRVLQVGTVVEFVNPDRLEASRIFECVQMKIRKIVDTLAFCLLPNGSEQSFGVRTLVPIT